MDPETLDTPILLPFLLTKMLEYLDLLPVVLLLQITLDLVVEVDKEIMELRLMVVEQQDLLEVLAVAVEQEVLVPLVEVVEADSVVPLLTLEPMVV